jgi:hypothetical protein
MMKILFRNAFMKGRTSNCLGNFLYHLGMVPILFASLLSASVYAATLTASVDRNQISLEDVFTLVLRFDKQVDATPDFTELQRDFDVINTQYSSQVQIVNGNYQSFMEWRVALSPKRTGTLNIPALTIQGATSAPIDIHVESRKTSASQSSNDVSVEMEVNVDSAYVQQQIILTSRLFTTVGLSSLDIQPLQIPNAVVVQLDEKQYQTNIDNRPAAVVETKYAIFPQQSGELVIPSILYQVSVGRRGDMWNQLYGGGGNNQMRLRTEEIRVPINPAPASAPPQQWLPADRVEISEHWSSSPDQLTVGEPVTRTITIKAYGATAAQIPPLNIAPINGATFYADKAQSQEEKTPDGVVTTRIETIAIVPTASGTLRLPAIEVPWWSNSDNELQVARLPDMQLSISSGAMRPDALQPPSIPTEAEITSQPVVETAQPLEKIIYRIPLWSYVTHIALLLIALFFAGKWWTLKRRVDVAASGIREHVRQQHRSENDAWTQLKKASSQPSAAFFKESLLQWASHQWQTPTKSIDVLKANIKRDNVGEPLTQQIIDQLSQLDKAIYGQATEHVNFDEIIKLLTHIKTRKFKQRQSNSLRAIYPTD